MTNLLENILWTKDIHSTIVDNITKEFTKLSPVETEISEANHEVLITDDDPQEFDLFYSSNSDSDKVLDANYGQDRDQFSNDDRQHDGRQHDHTLQQFGEETQEKIETGSLSADVNGSSIEQDIGGSAEVNQKVEAEEILKDIVLPEYLVSPESKKDLGEEVSMLTVVVRSGEDKMRDELRLRRIHGIITSYPGNDRFSFHIFESGKGYLVEFPNYTVGICEEMLDRIARIVERSNLRVEKITFQ